MKFSEGINLLPAPPPHVVPNEESDIFPSVASTNFFGADMNLSFFFVTYHSHTNEQYLHAPSPDIDLLMFVNFEKGTRFKFHQLTSHSAQRSPYSKLLLANFMDKRYLHIFSAGFAIFPLVNSCDSVPQIYHEFNPQN